MQTNGSGSGLGVATASPRDAAFVVHLVCPAGNAAGEARGRVEHVVTGRVARFASADELVGFMTETLAAIARHEGRGE